MRFNARSRFDLGLGIPLFKARLILAILREHLVNDPREVSSESSNRLVVLFALGSFLFIVSLRLRHILSMTIQSDHHRCLCPGVDVLGGLGALILSRTVVQRGHAQIES